jgi:hypothetical protein
MPTAAKPIILVKYADTIVRAFDLQTPLVSALISLAKTLGTGNYADAFAAIVDYINGRPTLTVAQKTAVKKLIDGDSSIHDRVAALLTYAGRDNGARFIASTLADTPGSQVNYDLAADPKDYPVRSGDVTFQIAGKANASAQIQVHKPSEAKDLFRLSLPESDALLRFGMDGDVDVTGSVRSSFSSGTVSGAASAGASAELDLIFQYPLGTHYVDALVLSALGAVMPWDLDQLSERLATIPPTVKGRGLRAVHLGAKGHLDLAAEVGVGIGWKYESPASLGQYTSVIGISGSAGVKLNVRVRRHGTFSIVVQRGEGSAVVVDVVQNSEAKSEGGIDLGLDLAITGLDQLTIPFIHDVMPEVPDKFKSEYQAWLGELEKWSRLGDALSNEMRSLVLKDLGPGGGAFVKNFARYLFGIDDDSPLSAVLDELATHAIAVVNERGQIWSDDVANDALGVVTDLAESFGMDTETSIRGEFEQIVRPIIERFLQDQRDALTAWLEKSLKKATGKLDTYLKPLDTIAQDSRALAKSLQDGLNAGGQKAADAIRAVVAPFQRLLHEYQALRNRVVKALEQTAKIRLAMHWYAGTQRTSTSGTLLRYEIRKLTSRARMIYRATLTGRLDSVWPDFMSAVAAGEIAIIDGIFSAGVAVRTEIGFSLEIFGRKLSTSTLRLTDVQVEVDPAGRVVVGFVKATVEKVADLFGDESRAISGFAVFDIASAMRPGAVPTPLGFSMSYADKHMTDTEVRQYLGSLERAAVNHPILSAGASDRAANWLRGRQAPREARIDIALGVDRIVLSALAHTPDIQVYDRAVEYQVLLFAHPSDRDNIRHMANTLPEAKGSRVDFVRLVGERGIEWVTNKLVAEIGGGSTAGFKQLLKNAEAVHRRAKAMQRAFVAIGRIERDASSIVAVESNPGKQAVRMAKELAAYGEDITGALKLWLNVNNPIKGIFTERLPDSTIAFIALLADVADLDSPLLVPILTTKNEKYFVT